MKALFAVVLLACAAFAQDDAAVAKARTACGPDNIFFDVKTSETSHAPATPEAGKALVFVIHQVYTPNNCEGGDECGILARVGMDGSWAGAMYGASYLYLNVEPGEHHLCTNWQSIFASRSSHAALTSFTAEAGHIYYFRMRLFGDRALIMDLDQINSDEGKYLLASYQESESRARKPRKNYAEESN
ncbi:MAG TPA: hypothetical protein VKH81_07995 [Candidatus Angelobacter sp.]|nr:hypothetical protein [Candidatus Angelobacter sp.]